MNLIGRSKSIQPEATDYCVKGLPGGDLLNQGRLAGLARTAAWGRLKIGLLFTHDIEYFCSLY
jgi:hypothetical protein